MRKPGLYAVLCIFIVLSLLTGPGSAASAARPALAAPHPPRALLQRPVEGSLLQRPVEGPLLQRPVEGSLLQRPVEGSLLQRPVESPAPDTWQTTDGLWFSRQPAAAQSPLQTGGPDLFGYTWDDSLPPSWVDASGGSDTGINETTEFSGAIPIGFDFDYYEYTYSQLYVSRHGFISFFDQTLDDSQSNIPDPDTPNNVIAPYWVPSEDVTYVKTLAGGSSPDRWLVIEWNGLVADNGISLYNFELILHENGDITFQYASMYTNPDGHYCQSSGIEDSVGLDGLAITEMCQMIPSDRATFITRPPDHANLALTPATNGGFVEPLQSYDTTLTLHNNGTLGAESYSLMVFSDWPVSFWQTDGTTPLSTPILLDQGARMSFIARVYSPDNASPAETNQAHITLVSSIDPATSRTTNITHTFPLPFAQALYDGADGSMSTFLVTPGQQDKVLLPFSGGHQAVLELPNGNLLYAWTMYQCVVWQDTNCLYYGSVIQYAIRDHAGAEVLAPVTLSDMTGVTAHTYDTEPFLAVTPDGSIGVLWRREQNYSDPDGYYYNFNIHFAVLNPDGSLLHPQENITNYSEFYAYSDFGLTTVNGPRLAATSDGRFLLGWSVFQYLEGGDTENVMIAIRDSTGGLVLPVTNFTNYAPDTWSTEELVTVPLAGNRFFIIWSVYQYTCDESDCWGEDNLDYSVVDSAGNVLKPLTTVPDAWLYYSDGIQLSDGTVLVAMGYDFIGFLLFDGVNFNTDGVTHWLPKPLPSDYNLYPSLARAPEGRAVITWQTQVDVSGSNYLSYAVVESDGTLVTPPVPYYQAAINEWGNSNMTISDNGQGITSYDYEYAPIFTSQPPEMADIGRPYTYAVQTTDWNLPDDSLTITAPTLPAWLTLTDHGDGTATLSGVAPAGGGYPVGLLVEDSTGLSVAQDYLLSALAFNHVFLPVLMQTP